MTHNEMDLRLSFIGLTEDQKKSVMKLMLEGLDVKIHPDKGLYFKAPGMVEIKPAEHCDPSRTCNYEIKVDGIDDLRIRKIDLPTLDHGKSELLWVNVTLFPKSHSDNLKRIRHDLRKLKEDLDKDQ